LAAEHRLDLLGEFIALPRPPSWIKGSLLLKEGDGKEVEKRGWEGLEGEGGREE